MTALVIHGYGRVELTFAIDHTNALPILAATLAEATQLAIAAPSVDRVRSACGLAAVARAVRMPASLERAQELVEDSIPLTADDPLSRLLRGGLDLVTPRGEPSIVNFELGESA